MILSAAVVGLGRVGQDYDYDDREGRRVLTHASAFATHPGYHLAGGVDPSPAKRERFERKFGARTFGSVEELCAAERPEVVALAVPTAAHAQALAAVLEHAPRAVICEKPLAPTTVEGRRMVESAREAGCTLVVNYMRRFDPTVVDLRRRIARGELGEVYKGTGWYTRGFLENGSHLVDLVALLVGGVTGAACVAPGPGEDAAFDPDVRLTIPGGAVYLLAARDAGAPLVQLELAGTRAVLRYLQGGLAVRLHQERPDETFPEETVLDPDGSPLDSGLDRCQLHVVDALHAHLTEGAPLASTGETALETLRICEAIIEEAEREGQLV